MIAIIGASSILDDIKNYITARGSVIYINKICSFCGCSFLSEDESCVCPDCNLVIQASEVFLSESKRMSCEDLLYFEEKVKENTPCKVIKIYDKRLLPNNRMLLNRIRRYC